MNSKELIKKIEGLRSKLYKIMEDKNSLTDKEILEMSKKIDELLNKYIKEKYVVGKLKKQKP